MGFRTRLTQCCSRFDNVDFLAFRAPRVAVVRDPKLGCLNICLQLLIVSYVVVFNLIIEKGYRADVTILSASRFRLFVPPAAGVIDVHDLQYCQAPPSANLPDGRPVSKTYPEVERCVYMDAFGARHPPIEDSALFVTTRFTIRNETLPPECYPAALAIGCQTTVDEGGLIQTSTSQDFFLANVERYLIEIEHGMEGEGTDIRGSSRSIPGKLVDTAGNSVDYCHVYTDHGLQCPSNVGVGVNGQPDIVPLGALLTAAGFVAPPSTEYALDAPSSISDEAGNVQSIRRTGVVLDMKIDYSNFESHDQRNVRSTYEVIGFPGEVFDVEEVESLTPLENGGAWRTVAHRFGVRLLVQTSGHVGAFSLPILIVNLVAGLGLLIVATYTVIFVAGYCLNEGALYERYWLTETPTSGDLLRAGLTTKEARPALGRDPVNPDAGELVMQLQERAKAVAAETRRGSSDGGDGEGEDDVQLGPVGAAPAVELTSRRRASGAATLNPLQNQ